MINPNRREFCCPTRQQELLLKAALQKGPESILSWEKWIDCIDVNAIDPGSQRLLPLLVINLRLQGISHPLLSKFKDVYRQTWYRNQKLLNEMASVIESFHEVGIETMVLKGAALIIVNYKNPGLRPMDDFDLLVPSQKIIPAINHINKLLWRPEFRLDKLEDLLYVNSKGFHFSGQSGNQLDLHRYILIETPYTDANQDFWDGAIQIRIGSAQTLALNPADQLLHTCVHGLFWNPVPPLRWVADAYKILQTTPTIDWDRLLIQAEKYEVILTMKEALQYLSGLVNAPIPSRILESIQHLPVSSRDRMEYRLFNHSPGLTGILPRLWFSYSYGSAKDSKRLRRLLGFARFLQHFFMLNYLVQVPFYILYIILRRFIKWLLVSTVLKKYSINDRILGR